MYPRKQFFDKYNTDAPRDTSIGYVCIFVFCSVVFVFYDWAVRSESERKELVLDTKRRFVRFISHEMRTPMNTVHLGLKLFQIELEDLLNVVANTSPEKLAAVIKGAVAGWMMLVDDIMGNSESAVDVLNDLLNYDKIEMGTLRLEFSTVPIFNLVKKTTKAFMMQAKQKDVDLQLVGDYWITNDDGELELLSEYEGLSVVGDATRIAQVLRNLLSNALKFTPTHGTIVASAVHVPDGLPEATVVVPADQQGLLQDARCGSVKIFITDSGAGLSEEQLAHICTEGMQFNANQLQAGGGSGLGLFISKGLAEQHGGGILVSSEGLGKGSTFRVELPLFRHDEDNFTPMGSMRTKPMHRSESGSSGTGSGKGLGRKLFNANGPSKVVPVDEELENIEEEDHDHQMSMSYHMPERARRVLVIDDATSNRKLLIRILKAKGYVCDEAEDGQKGLDLYVSLRRQGEIIDAILMDFEMPVMNGPTATKVLRDLGCKCFIAGVTGNVLPADIDHFKAQGADTVLAKPMNLDTFEVAFAQFRFSMDRADETDAHGEIDCRSVEQVAPLVVPLRISNPNDLGSRADMEVNLDRMENGEHTQDSTFRQDTEE
uniref:histidine kinase n=1 Tax=Spumella elongata TaxID=89044 RepID=A0A7S3GNB6_9STRA